MPKTPVNRRFWIPHVGGLPHAASPSGLTYVVQMRVPGTDNPSSYFIALSDFTLDYPEALRWLHALREKAARHLMATRFDNLE